MDEAVYNPVCEVININVPAANGYWNKMINVVKRIRTLRKLKRELKIDVSISFGTTANLVNALSKVSDKIILSVRGYGSLSGSSVSKFIDKVVYSRGDTIVCVAEKLSRDLSGLYHIPAHKVCTLYNPYDFDSITEQAQAFITLEISHPAIVTMGRLEKVKGYRHLLRAFALVQQDLPGATLVFIGEGSERDELERLVAVQGLTKQVVFFGFQSNPFSYLAKCDLYALSSITEGFPNALVEAMTCSLPVVAADCKSGPREIVTETYNDTVATEVEYADYGILIPPFAEDESNEPGLDQLFADALLSLLKNKGIYEQYRERAQERARAFSYKAYKNKIIEIIER